MESTTISSSLIQKKTSLRTYAGTSSILDLLLKEIWAKCLMTKDKFLDTVDKFSYYSSFLRRYGRDEEHHSLYLFDDHPEREGILVAPHSS